MVNENQTKNWNLMARKLNGTFQDVKRTGKQARER
jgi:hypothetical protein